ncbi:DUF4034 domain-containing protein [Glaciecola petra]|uniref:DUF4034 domain-containing protein n=1 Tax=Glaciecola petra TaxID=3075602 RepID=A0ABU2ZRR5_9ALTE|nr:DUF4034 domain-containing protein [Aestuariibacter sp. P117]MDT0595317.1 DUF4034 domain-containing protein [Aestuariibacter sp. P117]
MIKELIKRLFDASVHMPHISEYDVFVKKSVLDELINRQNWHSLFELYLSCSEADRHFLLVSMYEHDGRSLFQQLPQLFPQNYVAHLMLGAYLTGKALHLRRNCIASHIEDQTWEEIFIISERATQALLRAIEINAYDPQIYFPLIQVQTIDNEKRDGMTSYINAVTSSTKHHYPLYVLVLTFLTKKWGGSYEEMFSFAKHHSGSENAEPCMQGLIALAHIERWLGYAFDEEYELQKQYFEDEFIQQELHTSYSLFRKNAKQNGFYRTAANQFAFAFYVSGQNDLLKDALLFLNGHYFTRPWCYGSAGEAEVLSDALKRVGLNY